MRKQAAGFTLIELVVVIVILGILSAVALPKFVNLSSDARAAVVQGTAGAMRGANSMVYARAAVGGTDGAASGTVTINGSSVATVYGFASTATALSSVMDLDSKLVVGVCPSGSTTQCIYHSGVSTGQTGCFVSYVPAASATTPPVYTTSTGSC